MVQKNNTQMYHRIINYKLNYLQTDMLILKECKWLPVNNETSPIEIT